MGDQLTKEDITEAVKNVFTEGTLISPETHENHHRWLEEEIQIRKQCRINRNKIVVAVTTFLAISTVAWVGSAIYFAFTTGVHK